EALGTDDPQPPRLGREGGAVGTRRELTRDDERTEHGDRELRDRIADDRRRDVARGALGEGRHRPREEGAEGRHDGDRRDRGPQGGAQRAQLDPLRAHQAREGGAQARLGPRRGRRAHRATPASAGTALVRYSPASSVSAMYASSRDVVSGVSSDRTIPAATADAAMSAASSPEISSTPACSDAMVAPLRASSSASSEARSVRTRTA